MRGTNPCYPNNNGVSIYGVSEQVVSPDSLGVWKQASEQATASSESNPTSFLYNLSLLKDKVHQVQSLASMFLSPDHHHHLQPSDQSTPPAIAMPTMATLIQEIIVTASSMMFACQQMSLPSPSTNTLELHHHRTNDIVHKETGTTLAAFFSDHHDTAPDHWYNDHESYNNNNISTTSSSGTRTNVVMGYEGNYATPKTETGNQGVSSTGYYIVELDAADLLAKYTHYCAVCGKGFKRDANLRMHMRAHGDQYKSSAALSNPIKKINAADTGLAEDNNAATLPRKYSCPQEGCRWNKKHAKFQPLKSMICVKNHYKRSHCPKMYVCKRCNRKHFSVLSDLRTHEKHCGDLKWLCSCGTTFSRKDKLMGHVALFAGHAPAVSTSLSRN